MRLIPLAAASLLAWLLAGCAAGPTPEQQREADRQRCTDYGFAPGTDRFAQCMMRTDERRQDSQSADQARREAIRQRSMQRSGDPRFPVCNAAMSDVELDTTQNAWYGPNCRMR